MGLVNFLGAQTTDKVPVRHLDLLRSSSICGHSTSSIPSFPNLHHAHIKPPTPSSFLFKHFWERNPQSHPWYQPTTQRHRLPRSKTFLRRRFEKRPPWLLTIYIRWDDPPSWKKSSYFKRARDPCEGTMGTTWCMICICQSQLYKGSIIRYY